MPVTIDDGLTIYRVVMSYFVAGVLADELGVIRVAAPILAWSRGKTVDTLTAWVKSKRGEIQRL